MTYIHTCYQSETYENYKYSRIKRKNINTWIGSRLATKKLTARLKCWMVSRRRQFGESENLDSQQVVTMLTSFWFKYDGYLTLLLFTTAWLHGNLHKIGFPFFLYYGSLDPCFKFWQRCHIDCNTTSVLLVLTLTLHYLLSQSTHEKKQVSQSCRPNFQNQSSYQIASICHCY
jgi:hypothetical protein